MPRKCRCGSPNAVLGRSRSVHLSAPDFRLRALRHRVVCLAHVHLRSEYFSAKLSTVEDVFDEVKREGFTPSTPTSPRLPWTERARHAQGCNARRVESMKQGGHHRHPLNDGPLDQSHL